MPVPGLWMPVLLVLPDIGHVCWASLQYMLGLGWADLVPDRLLLVFLLGPWLLVLGPQLLAFNFLAVEDPFPCDFSRFGCDRNIHFFEEVVKEIGQGIAIYF